MDSAILSNMSSASNQMVIAGLWDLAYTYKTSLSSNDTVKSY